MLRKGMEKFLSALLANVLALAVLAWAAFLREVDSDAYYHAVQEDAPLEWATFFAFLAAAILHWIESGKLRGDRLKALFVAGLGIFCFVFAGEEISWGQRVVGFQPPEYFLANNYQQELNFHNVISTDMRMLTLQVLLFGYGIAVPFLYFVPIFKRWGERIGIVGPPALLLPSFIAPFVLFYEYPWSYSGEIAEVMWAFAFLSAPLIRRIETGAHVPGSRPAWAGPSTVAAAFAASALLGATASSAIVEPMGSDPYAVERTEAEVKALEADFRRIIQGRRKVPFRSDHTHQRVFTLTRDFDLEELENGAFAQYIENNDGGDRGPFFLDPWNNPYWGRVKRDKGRMKIFIYSFGPNHRRDSTRSRVLGDDIARVLTFSRRSKSSTD